MCAPLGGIQLLKSWEKMGHWLLYTGFTLMLTCTCFFFNHAASQKYNKVIERNVTWSKIETVTGLVIISESDRCQVLLWFSQKCEPSCGIPVAIPWTPETLQCVLWGVYCICFLEALAHGALFLCMFIIFKHEPLLF